MIIGVGLPRTGGSVETEYRKLAGRCALARLTGSHVGG